ncbi:glutathione S-transferase [Shewanella sp. C32]|uniref:Glutathione S-transferase n=1 Tax=Shewanella electrica TaxID=515560 RepID=A0ABT2FNP8_9GAMM|nr:glutathione S-transferase [Shewanella electrica]MCH1926189.1 glutathione S-transferase [Shewanella electrica]MCS4557646.1 glutathione S-transferase [Shewanella electrica]
MIKVHHLELSRSFRVIWLLEELGVEYEIITYRRDPKTYGAPAALKRVHPLGKSPVITDGEITVAESGAIIEYLLDKYDTEGQYRPTSGQALLDYRYWMHFAEGSMMPLLVLRLVLGKVKDRPMPFFVKPIARKLMDGIDQGFIMPRLQPQLELIDAWLKDHEWFAGDSISGADFQMELALRFAANRADVSGLEHITAYLEKVAARPAHQQADTRAK